MRSSQSATYSSNMSEISSSGVLPRIYEKQWVGLRHKRIRIPYTESKFPDPVNQTIQETELQATNDWKGFPSRVEYLSYSDVNVHPWSPELTQPFGGLEQIKGDDLSNNSLYIDVPFIADIDYDINVNSYRRTYQIENLSYLDAYVRVQKSDLTQRYGEDEWTNEDIHGSYSHETRMTMDSDVDVVFAHVGTGVNHRETYQRQIENLADVEPDAVFPDHARLLDEAVKTKEDIHGSYLHCTIKASVSEADEVLTHIGTETAITHITQLQKLQAEKQAFEVSEQFNILLQREDNWDERGSLKPTELTIAHAKWIMDAFIKTITSAGYQCKTPSISSDGYGNGTAAWYNDERQLHFQITEDEVEYFKVWGINIDTEMEVDFLNPDNYLELWKWLINEE